MTFDEYWTALNKKNPIPHGATVKLTRDEFYRLLRQTWEKAAKKQPFQNFGIHMGDFYG